MDKTPKKALKQLLCCAVNKDEALVLDSLHGYLYGLAIIPESIHLSEWLPDAFGEEMMGFNSEEEAILRIYWNPEDPPPRRERRETRAKRETFGQYSTNLGPRAS